MAIPIVGAVLWLIAVNVIAAAITMWDKSRARRREWRISESALWMVAALGGSAAMYTIMLVIRHKTKRRRFMIGLPLMLLAQVVILVLFWHLGYFTSGLNDVYTY